MVFHVGEEPGQQDHITRVDVGAHFAGVPTGSQQRVDRLAELARSLRRDVLPHRRLDRGHHPELDPCVRGELSEPPPQGFPRRIRADEGVSEAHELVDLPVIERAHQFVPGREVTIERALTHARAFGDRTELQLARFGDERPCGLDDRGAAAHRIGAFDHGPPSRCKRTVCPFK